VGLRGVPNRKRGNIDRQHVGGALLIHIEGVFPLTGSGVEDFCAGERRDLSESLDV
jgi:hypothetical protein